MPQEPIITVNVQYSGNETKPAPTPVEKKTKEPKPKKQKPISGVCPYCKTPLQTNKYEDKKCPQCGATVTYAEFKNQHAVLQSTQDGKKKFNFVNLLKKWWFWVAIVALVCLIIGLVVPSGSSKTTVLYDKNQIISVDNVSVTIKDVTFTNSIPALASYEYNTTNFYLVVLVTLTNDKSYSYVPTSNDFKVYFNNHTFGYLATESYYYGKNSGTYEGLYSQSIKPGLSDTLYLVFEVPESPETTHYIFGFKPVAEEVFIKLY